MKKQLQFLIHHLAPERCFLRFNRVSDTETLLAPLATEIGKAVIEWNDMHESFATLFATIVHPNIPASKISLAIWHSTQNDRAQRKMLLEAARAAKEDAEKMPPEFFADVKWLCERADSLADSRNNITHAPFGFALDPEDSTKAIGVGPATFFGNPRAIRLQNKDLMTEIQKCTAYAKALKLFARRIETAIKFNSVCDWPKKPDLPSLKQ